MQLHTHHYWGEFASCWQNDNILMEDYFKIRMQRLLVLCDFLILPLISLLQRWHGLWIMFMCKPTIWSCTWFVYSRLSLLIGFLLLFLVIIFFTTFDRHMDAIHQLSLLKIDVVSAQAHIHGNLGQYFFIPVSCSLGYQIKNYQ